LTNGEAALGVQILQKAGINAAAYPDDPAIAAQMNKILGRKKED
jgi:hypothetical protein